MKKKLLMTSCVLALGVTMMGVTACSSQKNADTEETVSADAEEVDLDDTLKEGEITDEEKTESYRDYLQSKMKEDILSSDEISDCDISLTMETGTEQIKVASADVKLTVSNDDADKDALREEMVEYISKASDVSKESITLTFQ